MGRLNADLVSYLPLFVFVLVVWGAVGAAFYLEAGKRRLRALPQAVDGAPRGLQPERGSLTLPPDLRDERRAPPSAPPPRRDAAVAGPPAAGKRPADGARPGKRMAAGAPPRGKPLAPAGGLPKKDLSRELHAVAARRRAPTPTTKKPASAGLPAGKKIARKGPPPSRGSTSVGQAPDRTAASAAPRVLVETCEIDLERGQVKSNFRATALSPEGSSYEAGRSPSFLAPRDEAPHRSDRAAEAHADLVERLLSDGWEPAGQGSPWYRMRFRRPPAAPVGSRVTSARSRARRA